MSRKKNKKKERQDPKLRQYNQPKGKGKEPDPTPYQNLFKRGDLDRNTPFPYGPGHFNPPEWTPLSNKFTVKRSQDGKNYFIYTKYMQTEYRCVGVMRADDVLTMGLKSLPSTNFALDKSLSHNSTGDGESHIVRVVRLAVRRQINYELWREHTNYMERLNRFRVEEELVQEVLEVERQKLEYRKMPA